MESTNWYFAASGAGYGPFTLIQMQQLVKTGLIGESEFVWQENDTEARHVCEIEGIRLTEYLPQQPSRSRIAVWVGSASILVVACVVGIYAVTQSQHEVGERNSELTANTQGGDQPVSLVDTNRSDDQQSKDTAQTENAVVKVEASLKIERRESLDQNSQVPVSSNAKPPETRQLSVSELVPRGRVVIGNIALATKGASVTGTYKGSRESLLDGDGRVKSGFAKAKLHKPIVVTLAETYQISRIRIHLIAAWLPNNSKESFYRYKVEVSTDGSSFDTVADRTSGRHRDWQDLRFTPRPVKVIRITGTHDHPHQTGIRIAEVEAYCTKDK